LVYQEAAKELLNGKVIGWFQGGSEFGPRALGNRSILADPRIKDMPYHLNTKVKFREIFRPYAPVIIDEYLNDYFETDFPINPFMLYVGYIKKDKREIIPAVTHVDNTARLQIINEKINYQLYTLIKKFYQLSGVPVLLNTSFNIKGKPIVENPADAMECFLKCDMDVLYLGSYKITKIKK